MADKSEGKVLGGKRYCGKTTRLIEKANKEWLYILCANENIARHIFNQAQDTGLDIPFPVTVNELPLQGVNMDKILIDEVEMVLEKLLKVRVDDMTTSRTFNELQSLKEKVNKSFFDEVEGIKPLATYRCVSCDYKEKVFGKKEDYKELMICPKCSGAFVDEYKMMKYKDLTNMNFLSKEESKMIGGVDFSTGKDWTATTIKQLKSIQREARKATAALKEKEQLENKYLVIEIDELGGVPKVIHEGEEIKCKSRVKLEWETANQITQGDTRLKIGYYDEQANFKVINEGTGQSL